MSDKLVVLVDGPITWEQSVGVLENADVEERFDLGHSIMYRLVHAIYGPCVMIHSSIGMSGLIRI